jgi:hypothetical protein
MILARMTIKGPEEYAHKLSSLGKASTDICKRAVKSGANPVANEMRKNLNSLQEDTFRRLDKDEKFSGVPGAQKKDLLDALGITPADIDREGIINAKVGFHGYGSHKTNKYPKGLPNKLLARAVESGSSVRTKTPFVRKAVSKTKDKSIEEMKKSIDNDISKFDL